VDTTPNIRLDFKDVCWYIDAACFQPRNKPPPTIWTTSNPNAAMQQPETTSYYRYWAKAHKPKDNEPLAYHVLPYHLLDVAAVLGGAL
jgi:hypothetical protein